MDTIDTRSGLKRTKMLSRLPSRLHHNAFVVKDHEVNRRFFEDLLGIPLVATWCEKSYSADLQREVQFCHTFFGMGDGSALAFFQFADPELYGMTQAEKPARIGRYDHIAFKAEPETYEELKQRLEAAGERTTARATTATANRYMCNHPTGCSSSSRRIRRMWPRSRRSAAPMRTANLSAGLGATAAPTTICAAARFRLPAAAGRNSGTLRISYRRVRSLGRPSAGHSRLSARAEESTAGFFDPPVLGPLHRLPDVGCQGQYAPQQPG